MSDIILAPEDIYLQDIVHEVVQNAEKGDNDVVIYNKVCKIIDIPNITMSRTVMRLIHLNQSIINCGG